MLLYNARDMAIVRARMAALCRSCSPRRHLRSKAMSMPARAVIERLSLPQRHGGAIEPSVATIDLRKAPPERGHLLSPSLITALARDAGAQRAIAPLPQSPRLCPAHHLPRLRTSACEPACIDLACRAPVSNRLVCHQTGFSMPKPDKCPACGTPDGLVACGPGVERVEEEVRALFPEARICSRFERSPLWPDRRASLLRGDASRRDRHLDRHTNRRQRPSFPGPHAGWRRRRRSRLNGRRFARGGTHFSAAASGGRASGARRTARPRAPANLYAGSAR